jgi:hypothetical protein
MSSEFVLEILTSASVSAVLSASLIFLSKSWITERLKGAIKSEYDQKLETHKAQLKSEAETQIEQLKASLSIAAAEKQVKFSKLHENRAEVIANTYSLLKNTLLTFKDYVKAFEAVGELPRSDRKKVAVKAHNAFREYFPTKTIYIPIGTADKIDAIDKKLVNSFNQFALQIDGVENRVDYEKWDEVIKRLSGEVSEALTELEIEFRHLLGDES